MLHHSSPQVRQRPARRHYVHQRLSAKFPRRKFDPFKALVVPRPVGWIGTQDRDGRRNLAPYSFFNAVSDRPPMVMFSSGGSKDTLRNVLDTGEFTCSFANWDLHEAMNLSSAAVKAGVDEFELASLEAAPSKIVKPPYVARAPAAFECRLWKTVELPAPAARPGAAEARGYTMVIGEVLAIYIDDRYITDGLVQTGTMRPVARLGYMDYSVVTSESLITLNRPVPSGAGSSASVQAGPWDGVYR